MRRRDVQAIAFCAITISGLLVASLLLLPNQLVAGAITLAYAAWLLTRPRMVRVFRRMRGEDPGAWGAYFRE